MNIINTISKIIVVLLIIILPGINILVTSCNDHDNGTSLPESVPTPENSSPIMLMNALVPLDADAICGNGDTYCWEGYFIPRLIGTLVRIQATSQSSVDIQLAVTDSMGEVITTASPDLGSADIRFEPSEVESHMVRVWVSSKIPATITVAVNQQCPPFYACGTSASPEQGPTSPEPHNNMIIVDKGNPNAVPPPCGTAKAVCGSITDGLSTAAGKVGIPTILIKSGEYIDELDSPIPVDTPVILKAERPLETIVQGGVYGAALMIVSSGVVIDGLRINSGYMTTAVDVTGSVTIRNSEIRSIWDSAVFVHEGGTAIINHSTLYRGVLSRGRITLKNSTITSYNENTNEYESCVALYAGRNVLENNTLYGSFHQYSSQEREASHAELRGNTIHGSLEIEESTVIFTENTILGGGIRVGRAGTVLLFDNLIKAFSYALQLTEASNASISQNRFDTETKGVPILGCEDTTTLTSDGTNRLLNPNVWISCGGLPISPGAELF